MSNVVNDSEQPVRVGVIGAGRIGRMHAEILAHGRTGANLEAIYDIDESTASAASRMLRVQAAASVDEIMSSDLDAVAICTTGDTHAQLSITAAQAGKAIFCEKPVSLDLTELDQVLEAVERAGVVFQVGLNRRFDPAYVAVRAAVDSGEIGEPHLVRITSRDPEPPPMSYIRTSGGLFLDMMIHDFDMARFLAGSDVVEVHAHGAVRITPALSEIGDIDTALVTLVHENECLTSIDNSRRASYGFDQRIEVHGANGMARADNPLRHSGMVMTATGIHHPGLSHVFMDRYMASFVGGWRAFAAAVRGTGEPAMGTEDIRAPLLIGLAADRSRREHRPIQPEESLT